MLCWTSFHGDTDGALQSLVEAIQTKVIDSTSIRVVSLAMDEEPFAARSKARKIGLQGPTECLWTGEEGWTSKPARALAIEESAPTMFLFDETAACIASGDLDDILASLLSPPIDETMTSHDLIGEDAWTSICRECIKLRTENKGRLVVTRRTTIEWWPDEPSKPSISQRFIVSGEIFDDSVTEVKKALSPYDKWIRWVAIMVTRPIPFTFHNVCNVDSHKEDVERSADFHCMVCDRSLCNACQVAHEKKHPLLLTKYSQGKDMARSLFGIGHVEMEEEDVREIANRAGGGNHPDIGCDACLSAIPSSGIRFKNLAVDEHELCEKCFKDSVEPSQVAKSDKAFAEKFFCNKKDPFCQMRDSRGVAFNRLAKQSTVEEANITMTLSHAKQNPVSPNGPLSCSSTKLTNTIPYGHTAFSWMGTVSHNVPNGHTGYSWGI